MSIQFVCEYCANNNHNLLRITTNEDNQFVIHCDDCNYELTLGSTVNCSIETFLNSINGFMEG